MTASTDTETANVSTIQKPFNLEGSVTVSNGPATICNKKRPLAPPEKELSASERKPVVRGGGDEQRQWGFGQSHKSVIPGRFGVSWKSSRRGLREQIVVE
jgi:hypothetical protein